MSTPLMRNPYAASVTRDSDIRETEWPCTSASLCADVERLSSLPEDEVNQPILSLIKARQALFNAALACRHASKRWEANPKVHDRLLSLAHEVLDAHARFPLEVDGSRCGVKARAIDGAALITAEPASRGYHVVEE